VSIFAAGHPLFRQEQLALLHENRRSWRAIAAKAVWAAGQPLLDFASNSEMKGCDGVGEVTFRPLERPDRFAFPVGQRGKNAASVRRR
jgi:hypothetical protein